MLKIAKLIYAGSENSLALIRNMASNHTETTKSEVDRMCDRDWVSDWKAERTGCTLDEPNPRLLSHFHHLSSHEPDDKRIFVPCCGKTRDMLWLKDQGYQVFGADISDFAVGSFFRENSIEYNTTSSSNFVIYVNHDRSISIHVGNLLDLDQSNFGRPFTKVWDRGALDITKPHSLQRKRYFEVLRSLTKPGARILIGEHWPEVEVENSKDRATGAEEKACEDLIAELATEGFLSELLQVAPALPYSFVQSDISYRDMTFLAVRQ